MKNIDVQRLLAQYPDDAEIVMFRQGSNARSARPVLVARSLIDKGDRYLSPTEGVATAWHETLGVAFVVDSSSESPTVSRKKRRAMQERYNAERSGSTSM